MTDDQFTFDSEWNEAKAYFYRIHLCLMANNDASLRHDYGQQFDALNRLHAELVAQMSKDAKKKDDLELESERLRSSCENLIFAKSNIDILVLRRRLFDYERHLRFIMKLRKMDLPRSKDPGKAILN
jgi:hypothetical protein